MARLDIKTLVLAFEKRIESLEKNPPDKIATSVIINLLENSIDEIIKDHFIHLIKIEMEEQIKVKFQQMKVHFIEKTIDNILTSEEFRNTLEEKLKKEDSFGYKGLEMTKLKPYTTEELSLVINETAKALQKIGDGMDNMVSALKHIILAIECMNKNVIELKDKEKV